LDECAHLGFLEHVAVVSGRLGEGPERGHAKRERVVGVEGDVGDGPLRTELQALATRLGVADRVHFAGAVPHERMCQAYHGADLFVQASWHEAQGMALLEGLACGLPALGTAVGCLPEVASGVRPGDAVGLGDALRAWGAAPRETARLPAEFSLPRAAARFIELYNQCSGER
ncbi:MAG: glycosyltransferase, partial [Chloroflexi bacterium]|nr:glycosyltransferase [Chloroflexota bacterium]